MKSAVFICSLYRIETLAMPFNFQPTIFSIKMQYSRPCKYSRPWFYYKDRNGWKLLNNDYRIYT